jgi:hypothetical protein
MLAMYEVDLLWERQVEQACYRCFSSSNDTNTGKRETGENLEFMQCQN